MFTKPFHFNFAYSLMQDAMRSSTTRQPLREVKVQCNLTAEPLPTCPSCSSVDWQRYDDTCYRACLIACVVSLTPKVLFTIIVHSLSKTSGIFSCVIFAICV